MKNHILTINGVYDLIREHYVSNFPYKLQFQAVDALNKYIKRQNEHAFLTKTEDGKYILKILSQRLQMIALLQTH